MLLLHQRCLPTDVRVRYVSLSLPLQSTAAASTASRLPYHPPGTALHLSLQVHLLFLADDVLLGFVPHHNGEYLPVAF